MCHAFPQFREGLDLLFSGQCWAQTLPPTFLSSPPISKSSATANPPCAMGRFPPLRKGPGHGTPLPHMQTQTVSQKQRRKTLVGCDSPFLVNSRRHTHTAIDGAREPRPAQCEPTRAPRWWRRRGTRWLRGRGRVTGAGCNGRAPVSRKGRGQSGGAPFSPGEEPLGALPALLPPAQRREER